MFMTAGLGKGVIAGLSLATFMAGSAMVPHCTELVSPCGGDVGKHYAPLMTEGALENPHTDCVLTSGNEFPKHWPTCQPGDDAIDMNAYTRAQQFAESGEVEALIAVGQDLPGYVRYNRSRNAVQLYACDGYSVASSLSVPAQMVQAAGMLE